MNSLNKKRVKILLILTSVIIGLCLMIYQSEKTDVKEITFDRVISYVKEGEVQKIETQQNYSKIWVTLKNGTVNTVVVPSMEEFSNFISKEIENGAEIEFVVKQKLRVNLLMAILMGTFIGGMFSFLKHTTGGKYEDNSAKSDVKFSDVAGIEEEKSQLEEIVYFLKNHQKYISRGARIPKGVLLSGAPGTGKTLLAKAIAGEAGVPFFQVTGSSFEEKYVGVGASRMRKLFKEAKKNAPCIIFIDEIDSLAQRRYKEKNYHEQTLNQLLAEMDGFGTEDNIIVIAATNHKEVLDEALTRAGRFDRHIYVPMPDVVAREAILRVHAENKRFDESVSLKEIAKKTVGFSGADLENVLNEAAIYCVNNGKWLISIEDIDESIARVLVGLEKKNSAITESDKRLTAIHEAGHAIVSAIVRPDVRNFGISIVPRGKSGGYNFFDESNKTYLRKSDLSNQIQVLYGGMLAEEVCLGEASSGASSDLEKASQIAYNMVTRFGMNGSLLTKIPGESDFNSQLESIKMEEVQKICKEAYDSAYAVVEQHKTQLLELADILIQKEYLAQEEVEMFITEKI